MIKLIAIVDANFGVSKNGGVPWSFKDDMRIFKEKTKDCVVVMGKNTYHSLLTPPLRDRINCVISSTLESCDGAEVFRSIDEVVDKYSKIHDLWVIGGAQLFNSFLEKKLVEYAFITQVRKDYHADTFIDRSLLVSFNKKTLFENDEYLFNEYLSV